MCGAGSASVQTAQSLAVLKLAMQSQRREGDAAVQLLQAAGQVQQVAAEPGKGERVDVTA